MDNQVHNQIVSFIWGIADDCLRDIYVRGKYISMNWLCSKKFARMLHSKQFLAV